MQYIIINGHQVYSNICVSITCSILASWLNPTKTLQVFLSCRGSNGEGNILTAQTTL